MKPLFVPRLPETARRKMKTGGVHSNKRAPSRAALKRQFQRQTRSYSRVCLFSIPRKPRTTVIRSGGAPLFTTHMGLLVGQPF